MTAKVLDWKTSDLEKRYDKSQADKPIVRCAATHKPLKIGEYIIYGGSCFDPVGKDFDVYVGFENAMRHSKNSYPWSSDKYSFAFPIQDGSVPTSIEDFRKLLTFLETSLKQGKSCHIGCIGGHGRTGLVLSALVMHMTGNKNATEYVRTNYCKKAVETHSQIDWLFKHFGIDKTTPSKTVYPEWSGQHAGVYERTSSFSGYQGTKGVSKPPTGRQLGLSLRQASPKAKDGFTLLQTVVPVRVKGNIWGF